MCSYEIVKLADEAKANIAKIGARSVLLEAAMRVIVAHSLIDDLVEQVAAAKAENTALSTSETSNAA